MENVYDHLSTNPHLQQQAMSVAEKLRAEGFAQGFAQGFAESFVKGFPESFAEGFAKSFARSISKDRIEGLIGQIQFLEEISA